MFRSAPRLVLLSICCLPCAACGADPDVGFVKGRVTLDQQPIEHATVMFQPSQGITSYGMTDADGNYELQQSGGTAGAVIGSHSITIETYRIAVDSGGDSVEHPERIPTRYNSESELVCEVKAGEQVIDFDLETP